MTRAARKIACLLLLLGLSAAVLAGSAGLAWLRREAAGLPDVSSLSLRASASTSVLVDGRGREVGRFAEENRVPVPLAAVPPLVVGAFLSAEDRNYFRHAGVDPSAVARAAVRNLRAAGSGRRPEGASTITQQVAKNLVVGNEVSLRRKAREALAALRMDRVLGKERVLELYLNEIYLGEGAYGVAAAAEAWFSRPLASLDLAEAAFLAGLPKAPAAYDPARRPEAARARRSYVLGRMVEDGRITESEAVAAASRPLPAPSRRRLGMAAEGWFPEEARREVVARVGAEALYRGGLRVRTSLDPDLQEAAEAALREGLIAFDRRRGWTGAEGFLPGVRADLPLSWTRGLGELPPPPDVSGWRRAVVLAGGAPSSPGAAALLGFADGGTGLLPLEGVRWAARPDGRGGLGPAPRRISDVVRPGDVVLVRPSGGLPGGAWELARVPEVQGSLVAMESSTGRVVAVVGGFDARAGRFNRATQARRQPGSTFKTMTYVAALAAGYDPTSPVLDAPIALDEGPGRRWRPEGGGPMGLITLRRGLELSRNLASVRLLHELGVDAVGALGVALGVYDRAPANMASALGAVETTNLRLTAAYAALGNGGLRVRAGFLDEIADANGRVMWRRDASPPDQVLDPVVAAQAVSILEGVVRAGTASSALGRSTLPLAGKTGTTNDNHDAWFVGLLPGWAVGVHIGFDRPRDMGTLETGGRSAAPVFGDFAARLAVLRPLPPAFPLPPGARVVQVDPATGEESRTGRPEIVRGR